MKKFLAILATIGLFFGACSEQNETPKEQNEVIPSDVNISVSETNVTVDENFPPEPVMEEK
ncbi:MAG: hypothetical protein K5978_08250 [Campylobacter sp.]|nr:hypothetical protein [Campylobacter sp.]